MQYELIFLYSLLLTLIIEIPTAIIFIKVIFKYRELKVSKIVLVGFLASALTMPYFWFVLPAFISARIAYIVVGETSIILIEALIYREFLKVKFSHSIIVSLIANIASVLLGLLFQ